MLVHIAQILVKAQVRLRIHPDSKSMEVDERIKIIYLESHLLCMFKSD